MDLEHAIRNALDGEALLIAGAGFSLGAKTLNGDPLPTGRNLATELAAGLDDGITTTDLGILADMYKAKHGENGLLALLKRRLSVGTVSAAQKTIAAVPWRRAFTTNYDSALETAANEISREFLSLTFSDPSTKLADSQRVCLHCNGWIEQVDLRTLDERLILTNSSYMADAFNRTVWSRILREDLQVARSVIVIGYSLYDLDISRIVAATPEITGKTFFIVEETPPADVVFSLSRFGTVERVGVENFAERVEKISQSHSRTTSAPTFYSFYQHKALAASAEPVTDKAVYDLYVRGEFRRDLLPGSYATKGTSYFLRRKAIEEISGSFERGTQTVAAHSYLGNGKTLVAQGVAFRLSQNGYDVFEFEREKEGFERECDIIRRTTQKTLVIVEDYNSNSALIERLRIVENPNVKLLVTARTPVHIMEWRKLQVSLGAAQAEEFAVDALLSSELNELDDVLSRHGLLGSEARAETQ